MNGILNINKPEGWTSHDIVAKTRGILKEKRIGHGGTLDPLATGVLPLFIGRATRAVQFMDTFDKEYIAGLRPGLTTNTQDTTGSILSERHVKLTAGELEEVLGHFRGEISQLPPMYSAVKIGGKKLYEYARAGLVAERSPRTITISELELLDEQDSDFMIRVVCSKGTYIRTLIADIGEMLGCGAVMASLVRTRSGPFRLADACTLDELAAGCDHSRFLRPVDSLFASYDQLSISAEAERKCKNGLPLKIGAPEGFYRLYAESGEFLALSYSDGKGLLRTVKSFFEV